MEKLKKQISIFLVFAMLFTIVAPAISFDLELVYDGTSYKSGEDVILPGGSNIAVNAIASGDTTSFDASGGNLVSGDTTGFIWSFIDSQGSEEKLTSTGDQITYSLPENTTAEDVFTKIKAEYEGETREIGIKIAAKAQEEIQVPVKVRVEGLTETLYNQEIQFGYVSDPLPLDVLQEAVGEEQIEMIGDTPESYFITGILGEDKGENQGWCYYVKYKSGNIIFPGLGVGEFNSLTDLENNFIVDEMVFYKCSYSGANLVTKIPVVTVTQDGANFTIKVVNNEVGNDPIQNVDVKVGTEGSYKTDAAGEASFVLTKAGSYNVEISKDIDYPEIVRQHLVVESPGSNTGELESAITEIKSIYKEKEASALKAVEVMAYNALMNDEADYKMGFKANTSANAGAYAENIMGCLATNQDPKNYVDLLLASQDETGKFVVKSTDATSVTNFSDAIVALDMAKATFDEEKALTALVAMASDGHYEDATTTAYALRALLKHKDIAGVEGMISSSIAYLKGEQLDVGGYDYYTMGNSPYSTGPVLQALFMSDEDLSSDIWKKSGRTLEDSLLACKIEDGTYQSSETMGWDMYDPGATQFAFAAISDAYSGQSMYDRFVAADSGSEKNYNELITNAINGIRDYLTSMETRLDANYVSHPAFYRTLEVLALNCTSTDIQGEVEDFAAKFNINENEGTLPYALNIIGLKASGQDPQKYVDLLKAGQQEDGSFKVGTATQTEWAVIALDMVGAEYNEEKAMEAIISKNTSIEDVSMLAYAITALAPHKDIDGVETFINTKLDFIKRKQLDTGGFEMKDMMSREDMESSLPASYVISALVANGIDPLTDTEWIKGENTILDSLLSFKKLNYFLPNNGAYAEYFYKDEATEQAFVALADLQKQQSSYASVQAATSYKSLTEKALFKLRGYLTKTEKRQNASLADVDVYYSWQEALAINASSSDLNNDYLDIQAKLKIETNANILSYAQNIMGIIASGKKPNNFEGIDYIQKLVTLQNESGEFTEEGKTANVYKQAYSIIALDMAKAEYQVENAVASLVGMASDGNFGSAEETAWALIALSKHSDATNASALIDSGIEYLKSNQSDKGGFDMMGYGDTPQYTAPVIQALVANGVNPLTSEWANKNGNLVSSLINDQLENGTFRACAMFGDYIDIPSNERAFAALSDLYTGKSMYKTIEPALDPADILKNNINGLKKYYENDDKYNYLQAMGLNLAGMSLADITSKLEMRQEEADRTYIVWDDHTEVHAKDIMAIIAIGSDPRAYEGKNYVEILENAQNDNGEFNIEGKEANKLSDQTYSIIALDMADGEYDKEKAVSSLLTKYDAETNPSIYAVSETLIALSKHKEISGVQTAIDACIETLKTMQLETAGFAYKASSTSENSEYDSVAIQAIVAVGLDPLAVEFQKDGKTVYDAIMAFQKDDHFIYDQQKSSYDVYTDEATGMVLAALTDLDKGVSIYHTMSIEYTSKEEAYRAKVEAAVDSASNWMIDNFSGAAHWQSIAIAGAGKEVPASYMELMNQGETLPSASAGQHGKFILGILAAGGNPMDIGDHDLYEDLVALNLKADTSEYSIPFGVLALDAINYEIPADVGYTRADLVNNLLSGVESDGGFSTSAWGSFNDATCFKLTALGKYYNEGYSEEVTSVVDKTLEKIAAVQDEDGGFGANANSSAQALMAITFNKKDPLSSEFTKNDLNVIDYILSLQNEDGSFNWKKDNPGSVGMATEQALYALDQYLRNLDNKKSIYEFTDMEFPDTKAPVINLIGEAEVKLVKGSTYKDAGVTIIDDKDENLEATVSYTKEGEAVDAIDTGVLGTYVIHYNVSDSAQNAATEVTRTVIVEEEPDKADDLEEKANSIDSEEAAKEVVDDAKDLADSLENNIGEITSDEEVKAAADQSKTVIESLSKAVEKLETQADREETAKLASESVELTTKLIEKMEDKTKVKEVATSVIDAAGGLIANLGKEAAEDVIESTLNVADKAVKTIRLKKIDGSDVVTTEEKAVAELDTADVTNTIENIKTTITAINAKLSENGLSPILDKENKLTIDIGEINKKEIETKVSKEIATALQENEMKIVIKTAKATFNVEKDTFDSEKVKNGFSISGKVIEKAELPEDLTDKVPEGAEIFDFNAKVGEEKVSNFNSAMEITIPYTATVDSGNILKVYYLSDSGNLESMGGNYNAENKEISFKTKHFSKYFAKEVATSHDGGGGGSSSSSASKVEDKKEEVKKEEIKEEAKMVFSDLVGYEWARKAIETMGSKGIISGRGAGIFDPGADITRAEFAGLVTKMLGMKANSEELKFTDVPKDAWYYVAVQKAYQNGLICGRSETNFDPEGKITRQEMAAIISKVLISKGYVKAETSSLEGFVDKGEISDWAKEAANICVQEKIISGMGDNRFAPLERANRAQAAGMLYNLYILTNK